MWLVTVTVWFPWTTAMYVTVYSDCLVSMNHSHVCDCYSDCLVSMNHSHVCDCYSDCLVSMNHSHVCDCYSDCLVSMNHSHVCDWLQWLSGFHEPQPCMWLVTVTVWFPWTTAMYVTGYSDCLVSMNHSHVCDCYSDCLVSMNHSHVCDWLQWLSGFREPQPCMWLLQWLSGFREPLSPPYRCHGFKNVWCVHWFGGYCYAVCMSFKLFILLLAALPVCMNGSWCVCIFVCF